jgi:hypothetical protein
MHICVIQGATNFATMIGDLEVLDFVIATATNHENQMDEVFKDYHLLRAWAINLLLFTTILMHGLLAVALLFTVACFLLFVALLFYLAFYYLLP